MSGAAPAADSSNNLYFLTGNGAFDANTGGSNYGDSTVKMGTSGGLSVLDYFTPENQASLSRRRSGSRRGRRRRSRRSNFRAGPAPSHRRRQIRNPLPRQPRQYGPVQQQKQQQRRPESESRECNFRNRRILERILLHRIGANGHLNQFVLNTTTDQFTTPCGTLLSGQPMDSQDRLHLSLPLGPPQIGIVWALNNSSFIAPGAVRRFCTHTMQRTWAMKFGTVPKAQAMPLATA